MSHITDLCNSNFFFACRSYEYSKTTSTQRTKIITLQDLVFWKGNKKIINLTKIHKAETVSIVFTLQKKECYYETVMQDSNSCKTQNSVTIWVNIYKRVMGLKRETLDTPINAFFNTTPDRIEYITSSQILECLRWTVRELGVGRLGFTDDKIG